MKTFVANLNVKIFFKQFTKNFQDKNFLLRFLKDLNIFIRIDFVT